MNKIEIKGRDIFGISLTNQGEREYSKDSKMAGKKYLIFSYEGKAFAVNTEDNFVALQKAGKLYSATLALNEEGQLSLVGYVSTEQELAMAKFEAQIKQVNTLATFVPTEKVTAADIAALLEG